MVQLTITPDIDQSKMDVLLQLLKSWNVKAEIALTPAKSDENYIPFSESFGMWKDRNIDAKELRAQASGVNKRVKI
ncbi:hypothetical protein Barb7_00467 [Bacteroidales bacterium Barb7]|nr:hypothetical protein Barb7_00467 [Bacteroidales bacterium Barb7]